MNVFGMARARGTDKQVIWADDWQDSMRVQFKELFVWMAEEGAQAYRDQKAPTLYSGLNKYLHDNKWRKLDERELGKHIDTGWLNPNSQEPVPCVVLKPNDRHNVLPVLAPRFTFTQKLDGREVRVYPELRLRLALFFLDRSSNAESACNLKVIGYRFDMPEVRQIRDGRRWATDLSEHDYVHVQHINGFGMQDKFENVVAILPDHHPAWPIVARYPAEILGALYLGLYGKPLEDEAQSMQPVLRGFISTVPAAPARKCYKIRGGGVGAKHIVMWDQQTQLVDSALSPKGCMRAAVGREEAVDPQKTATAFWGTPEGLNR